LTLSELARRLNASPRSMSGALDKLRDAGLVVKIRGEAETSFQAATEKFSELLEMLRREVVAADASASAALLDP
jgi:DNA-binding MarR family transcriptional regulator